jgi:hypothetical protein
MGAQTKKKTRSFSLTDEEWSHLLDRVKYHGFDDRNEYLLALLESDKFLSLDVSLDATKQKVLRPKAMLPGADKFALQKFLQLGKVLNPTKDSSPAQSQKG